jgi:predicted small secreted protein
LKLLVNQFCNKRKYLILFFFLLLANCNTVTGSIEGTALGVAKDVKTTYHYSTCVFTKIQCGDLDLD